MKKTVVIFSAYISPHLGGIERYIENLTREFIKMDIKPIIVTSNFNHVKEVEKINGNTIIRLPAYKIFLHRYPIIKKDKDYRRLMSMLDDYKIDAIIVNTRFHLTSHVGASYAVKHNIPAYLIEHGSNYVTLDNKFIDFFANRYEDFLTWKIKNKVKGFYGVSKAAGEWLRKLNITYSGVWYNSIDCSQSIPERKKHDGVNFLYAGRLIKQKGVENILEAFMLLESKYPDIHLVIAGDGPEMQDYQTRFHSDRIQFVGKLNYQQLVQQYVNTDVFLYPPLWPEGLPTSILEAGLIGCAVIGTDQGGIKEIVRDKQNGLIVDTTVESLKDGMELMIKDRDLRQKYAQAMHDTVVNEFSWSVTAKKVAKDTHLLDSE